MKFPKQIPNREAYICFVGDYSPGSFSDTFCSSLRKKLVGNLECAITHKPVSRSKAYSILMNPDCSKKISTHHFIALNLANNHVYDAGASAFDKMVEGLREAIPNVQFYGLSETPCAEITLDKKKIAIIGCLEKCRSRGPRLFKEENVAKLIKGIRKEFDYIFVTPHWGKEGEYAFHPSPRQRQLARAWISSGADGVFGHHPHTIHGYEEVQGKPVFYSLGNFLFNHEESRKYPLTTLGLAVKYEIENRGSWQHRFFVQDGLSTKFIDGSTLNQANAFLGKISSHISGNSWAKKDWAKKVGPIYIRKSAASWKIRFKRGRFYKVFPLWFVWFLLPVNLVLRWGSIREPAEMMVEAKYLDSMLPQIDTFRS